MDIKLEKLKDQLAEICANISDNETTLPEVQEKLFGVMGDIDTIKEYYEDIKYSIEKLL